MEKRITLGKNRKFFEYILWIDNRNFRKECMKELTFESYKRELH